MCPSRPQAGAVIGFALSVGQKDRAAVWMTGDTVLHRPLLRTAELLDVDVLLMHLGSVRFPVTGPLRYSMNGTEAIRLVETLRPRVAVAVHYEGWSHFSERPDRLHGLLDRPETGREARCGGWSRGSPRTSDVKRRPGTC